jgi:hypothetical protein
MKPNNSIIVSLAFAAVCLTAIVVTPAARAEMNANGTEGITNGPQTNPGDAQGARSGLQNVRDSDRYEWLVHSNPNFRAIRGRKECGPTEDAPMHADCSPSLGR